MKSRLIALGRKGYSEAWDIQLQACQEVQEGGPDTLILVEHPPVMTLGAAFQPQNLLHKAEWYEARGIQVIPTDRGGDVTCHNPGQLVLYPIYDVSRHGRDLHVWMRNLEEAMIRVCGSLGLEAGRRPPHTGCWLGDQKVASIGVKVKRWVSIHGIALNCCNDLGLFDLIIPCGIPGRPMTSLSQSLGRLVPVSEVVPPAVQAFSEVFGSDFGSTAAEAAAEAAEFFR